MTDVKNDLVNLTLDRYQALSTRTLTDRDQVWNALGLVGEAGEVADLIKKIVYHKHDVDREKMKEELGDVMWYLAALATCAGISLSDVARANVEKLERRYPNGFSQEASRNR